MENKILLTIKYPRILKDEADQIKKLFSSNKIIVKLEETECDTIIITSPFFTTTNITLATALIHRITMHWKKK